MRWPLTFSSSCVRGCKEDLEEISNGAQQHRPERGSPLHPLHPGEKELSDDDDDDHSTSTTSSWRSIPTQLHADGKKTSETKPTSTTSTFWSVLIGKVNFFLSERGRAQRSSHLHGKWWKSSVSSLLELDISTSTTTASCSCCWEERAGAATNSQFFSILTIAKYYWMFPKY